MSLSGVSDFPLTVRVSLTSECNLSCSYCSHRYSASYRKGELSTKTWTSFFSVLKKIGTRHIELSGGEPFLRKDISHLISHLENIEVPFSIYTNSTILSEPTIRYLQDCSFLRGIHTSLDGANAGIHGICRGEHSFVMAVKGIKRLRECAIKVTVQVTIHKGNYTNIEEVTEFLIRELKINSVVYNAALNLGACHLHPNEIQLDVNEYSKAMSSAVMLKRKYPDNIGASSGPLADAYFWASMERAVKKQGELSWQGGSLVGCTCVFKDISILSDGTIVPCHLLGSLELGNIIHDNILDVWRQNGQLCALRSRHKISLSNFSFCHGCPYMPYCTGNCPALAINEFGFVDHPSRTGCLRDFLNAGGMIPLHATREEL